MNQNYLATLLGLCILGLFALIPGLTGILLVLAFLVYLYHWWQKADFSTSPIEMMESIRAETYQSEYTKLQLFLSDKSKYMQSSLWKNKRQSLIEHRQKCESCGSKTHLEIHHLKDYALIPNEPDTSLAVLCRTCHQMQHKHYGFPKKYNDYMLWNTPLLKQINV